MAQAKRSSGDMAAENAALRRRVAELEAELTGGPDLDITLSDGMGMAIYVADMETFELLYANEEMRRPFGKPLTGASATRSSRAARSPARSAPTTSSGP